MLSLSNVRALTDVNSVAASAGCERSARLKHHGREAPSVGAQMALQHEVEEQRVVAAELEQRAHLRAVEKALLCKCLDGRHRQDARQWIVGAVEEPVMPLRAQQ